MNAKQVKAKLGGYEYFSAKLFSINIMQAGCIRFFATPSIRDGHLHFGIGDHSGTKGQWKLSNIVDIYTQSSDDTQVPVTVIMIEV